jgi:hypothetical protein
MIQNKEGLMSIRQRVEVTIDAEYGDWSQMDGVRQSTDLTLKQKDGRIEFTMMVNQSMEIPHQTIQTIHFDVSAEELVKAVNMMKGVL